MRLLLALLLPWLQFFTISEIADTTKIYFFSQLNHH